MAGASIYKSAKGEQAVMAMYDSWLARWPVPHETRTVPTRHGDTFVIESGDTSAPALVLLHGAGTNSAIWFGDVAEYDRTYRVLAVDLIGEPGKSAPSRPDWNGPAYREWLEDVLDGRGIEAAAIVGVSQGAWMALRFAAAQPERVECLALLSPGGITRDKLSFVARVMPLMFLGRWGSRRINDMVLAGRPVEPEVEETLTLLMRHFKPRVGTLPLCTDDELRRLTMPVLLLMGGRDPLRDAQKIAARMQPLVPHLTVVTVPEGGHALPDSGEHVLPFLRGRLPR